ncbi:hypothetical protein HPHPH1_0777 [Helicobacter pylori Hp H-1]|uniref:Uncharacterized protein n=1 Tax=Helicobacter pylori Hp H-1 TaxID=992058 RepID=M7S3V0_HELPX|nr:hypothetical protein HPHPH1_0777 [Helicobacter pylori Hp H-1]
MIKNLMLRYFLKPPLKKESLKHLISKHIIEIHAIKPSVF